MTVRVAEPTARQGEVLRVVAEHQRAHGCPPTVRELGAALTPPTRTQAVMDVLERLREKGYLLPRAAGRTRTRDVRLSPLGLAYVGGGTPRRPGWRAETPRRQAQALLEGAQRELGLTEDQVLAARALLNDCRAILETLPEGTWV